MPRTRFALSVLLLLVLSCRAFAAPKAGRRGRDRIDLASTKLIAEYTTDPSFSTAWVDHVPASDRVPSPHKFLGYVIGAPDRLTPPETINDYFRALDKASKRVTVFSIGRSDRGRELIVAAISDEKNLARLDAIKAAHRTIADSARTSEDAARELASSTPAIYWVTAGLHSPETGPPEMVMELAYRLAVSEQDHIREIRKGVITLITPVLEMDGRARMVDWYKRYLTKVTDLEDAPPKMAPFWGDYIGHDNNRDGIQLSQPLTRAYVEAFHDYMPVLTLDLHESVPLLYVSTGTGPYNDTLDPITVTEWQWISSWEVSQATKLGLRGVWTWGFYDGWYPGYLLWVANNHNSIGRFYETFGNGLPGTFDRELYDSKFADHTITSRQWYRAWPPEAKLRWSLRDNINYQQTAVLASLQLAARNSETVLYNMWKKGHNAIERGKRKPPHGFVIPAAQRDIGALQHLLTLLAKHRIEVHRASAAAKLSGVEIAEGDYVVRADQRYGGFARTLLMKQNFPKTAPHTPYDDVAWSLDYMLGVDIRPVNDAKLLSLAMTRVDTPPVLPGRAEPGARWVVDHVAQVGLAGFVWALPAGARIRALKAAWKGHPAGSLIIEGAKHSAVDAAARDRRVIARALAEAPPSSALIDVGRPRVAIFHTWGFTQDAGWARYTFEQLGIPYTLINKDQVRAGKLGESFDVIVIPNTGGSSLADIIHDIDSRWGPMPYTETAEFSSHGQVASSEDITGGIGFSGLANLRDFLDGGGVVVAIGSAGRLIADSGLSRDVDVRSAGGSAGSHLSAKVLRAENPLAWGYPEITHVFRGNLPIYDVSDRWRGMAVVQFGTQTWRQARRDADDKADVSSDVSSDVEPKEAEGEKPRSAPLLLSGLLKDPDAIARKPAILDVPIGKGRAVLFSFNPLHRYQNHHDFGFVVNALLFHAYRPPIPSKQEMRDRER